MGRTSLKVLVRLAPVLFLVTVGTALLVELVPGDPAIAILGPTGSPEQYAAVRQELGLDQPLLARYLSWLGDILRGDLGRTLVPPVQDVWDVIAARIPVTLELAALATVLALLISIPAGVWSAYRLGERFDRVASATAFAIISLPSFLLALLLIYVAVFRPGLVRMALSATVVMLALWMVILAVGPRARRITGRQRRRRLIAAAAVLLLGIGLAWAWPEFPRQGFVRLTAEEGPMENLRSVFLPALTLALVESAQLTRLLRSDMATTLREDFVLAARAKGMPLRHLLIKEALRPSSFSLVTVAGISFGRLIGGTVIVETIFRLPGMGTLIVDSVAEKEFRVLQAAVLLIAVFYVAVNAVVDVSYAYLDPRIRRARA